MGVHAGTLSVASLAVPDKGGFVGFVVAGFHIVASAHTVETGVSVVKVAAKPIVVIVLCDLLAENSLIESVADPHSLRSRARAHDQSFSC
mmetsp:Transcript_9660/g.13902  ORF Transcript_9660/g.13902 Transcript_9660/m.13902 type:complete len:90 (+) Transcript_9660:791-1060(+)